MHSIEEAQQDTRLSANVTLFADNPPLATRAKFAEMIGLPLSVLVAQAERGYWPQVTVGKRVFINVEAVRLKAIEKAQEFRL